MTAHLRRHRHTIDDTLRLTLAVQRRTIRSVCVRIDQVQQQNDRQDSALTELESKLAEAEQRIAELEQQQRRTLDLLFAHSHEVTA